MKMETHTRVVNLMNDLVVEYHLPLELAVITAFEQLEKKNYDRDSYPTPEDHPQFREYRRGFSCGDWVTWKQ
jgi:hypothetical protein